LQAAVSHDSSAVAACRGFTVTTLQKSVHAWHTHIVLTVNASGPSKHAAKMAKEKRERGRRAPAMGRREATARPGESMETALQWLQSVQAAEVANQRSWFGGGADEDPEEEGEEEGLLASIGGAIGSWFG
jgi:hypothetical protein